MREKKLRASGLKPEGEAGAEPGPEILPALGKGGLSHVAQTDWVLGAFPKGLAEQKDVPGAC